MTAFFKFNFVDTHPFGDGNGHMCLLLASHTDYSFSSRSLSH